MPLSVPTDWITNHMRLASRLATVIEAQYQRSESTASSPVHYAAFLADKEWQKAAEVAGKTSGYSPSLETRVMVLEILRDHDQGPCSICSLRQADRSDRPMIEEGTEICSGCHSKKYSRAANDVQAGA